MVNHRDIAGERRRSCLVESLKLTALRKPQTELMPSLVCWTGKADPCLSTTVTFAALTYIHPDTHTWVAPIRGVWFYRFSGFYRFALFTVRKTGSFWKKRKTGFYRGHNYQYHAAGTWSIKHGREPGKVRGKSERKSAHMGILSFSL